MRNIVLLCFLVSLGVSQKTSLGESPIDEILSRYMSREADIGRYCAAIECRNTRVSFSNPEKSSDDAIWFMTSSDPKSTTVRYDEYRVLKSGETSDLPLLASSFFRVENRVAWKLGGARAKRFDSKSDDASQASIFPMVRVNPWSLPFDDRTITSGTRSVFHTYPDYKELQTPERLTSLKEDEFKLEAEFHINEKHSYYRRVTFDKKLHMLPVVAVFFTRTKEKNAKDIVHSVTRTTWGRPPSGSDTFLPMEIEMSGVIGNSLKPSETRIHEMEFFWVLDKGISDDVFDFEAPERWVRPDDLRDVVLDNAMKLVALKSAISSTSGRER